MWPFAKAEKDWQHAESLAASWLQRRGYRVLHRNLRLDRFEMDIIACKHDVVVFVEVRSREDDQLTAPEHTVRYTKRQHLRQAARRYIARYGTPDCYYRFDVIGVLMRPNTKPRITHIENAFTMDE